MALPVVVLCQSTLWAVPTIGRNFTGDTINQSGFIPPDTMGAVGPNHIVELINGRYFDYSKTTGKNVQTSTLNTFWSNTGITPTGTTFDPRIVYDPFAAPFAVSITTRRSRRGERTAGRKQVGRKQSPRRDVAYSQRSEGLRNRSKITSRFERKFLNRR